MIFSWLRQRRRQRILARPIPKAWQRFIAENVVCFNRLPDREKRKLIDDTRVFVAQKNWEAGRGVRLDDEMKVTIAAQACLLLAGFKAGRPIFPGVNRVVVLGTHYECYEVRDGRLHGTGVLGHTNMYGPVYLAWDSVRHGGRDPRDGRNLVYHEFAHKLDLADGIGDGTPILASRSDLRTWVQVMTHAYEELCERTEDGKRTLLDAYGTTNPAEFFAVATECFFEKARQMRERHPDLYRVLSTYYRQDPAGR